MINVFVFELIGTAILVLFGNGVVANVLLKDTKGHSGGWIVITFGWAMAVFIGVIASSEHGAHINPAVTLGLAIIGRIETNLVFIHILGQMFGAFIGAGLVWIFYCRHIQASRQAHLILACFCTGPSLQGRAYNFCAEAIATAIFMYVVLSISGGDVKAVGSLQALPIALLVLGIGLSLGGNTGSAINPARDLSPRVLHSLLPIANEGKSEWGYAWIPVVGPVVGAIVASILHHWVSQLVS